jgi:hypothetical protein
VAAHYPFQKSSASSLARAHGIAQINIINYKILRGDVRIHSVVRMLRRSIPEHACVLYFNNPFAEPIFARVLAMSNCPRAWAPEDLSPISSSLATEPTAPKRSDVGACCALREHRFGSYWLSAGSYELRIFETANSWRSLSG